MSFRDKIEELKKDKKKLVLIIGGVLLILICLIMGLLSFLNGSVVAQPQNTMSSIDIPVDTIKVNSKPTSSNGKIANNNNNNNNNDFFSMNEEVVEEQAPIEEIKTVKSVYKPRYSSGGDSYKPSYSAPVVKNYPSSPIVEPISSKSGRSRTRVPTDESGNMVNNGKGAAMYRGVVANENRLVRSGSYIKIRIAEELIIDGLTVPRNSVVSGIATHSQERTNISITSLRIGSTSRSVKWVVYDEDGNLGLPIPASVMNDISQSTAGEALDESGTKIETDVPVIGNVKVNLKKKLNELEYIIPNGHRLYIKEKKN